MKGLHNGLLPFASIWEVGDPSAALVCALVAHRLRGPSAQLCALCPATTRPPSVGARAQDAPTRQLAKQRVPEDNTRDRQPDTAHEACDTLPLTNSLPATAPRLTPSTAFGPHTDA